MGKIKSKVRGLVVLLLIAGAVGGGIWYYVQSAKEPPLKFLTTEARRGDLRSVIIATGTVRPVSMVSVGTQISGTVEALYFDYNSRVTKGQLIAQIDSATQAARVKQSDAALASLRADVADARASLALAAQNARRSRELFAGDLIARADLDASEASLTSAQARLAAADARITQQQASLEQDRLQLSYTRIHSPVDGVVVAKHVEAGQTVAASYNTPTIAEIAEDLSRMQVEVKVDEADIGSVREGQRAEFHVDAFPNRAFVGEVEQIRLSAVTESNVTSYTVIVKFENEQREGQNLIPGMTANVTLIVDEKKDVVIVPNAALRFRPLDPAAVPAAGDGTRAPGTPRGQTVYRLEDGAPAVIQVERGITDGTSTEIVSGLDEGTEVVTGLDVPRDNG